MRLKVQERECEYDNAMQYVSQFYDFHEIPLPHLQNRDVTLWVRYESVVGKTLDRIGSCSVGRRLTRHTSVWRLSSTSTWQLRFDVTDWGFLTSKLVITSAKSLICDSVFVKGLKTLSLLVGGEGSLVPWLTWMDVWRLRRGLVEQSIKLFSWSDPYVFLSKQ